MKIDRLLAAAIAAIAWFGLVLQFQASFAQLHTVPATLWAMVLYFTVIVNLLVAIVFTSLAFGWSGIATPFNVGGVTIAILLVGVVYNTLLAGMLELSGGAKLADTINHKATPVLVTLFWLFLAKKGRLDWNAPAKWALLPLAYFVYGLVRGHNEGKYPYPFMNLARLGWAQTMINAAAMALGFIAVGYVIVWLDRHLPKRR
ncbi:MAG: Pr6Pr family membrane protein [Sphingomonadales bacterium]